MGDEILKYSKNIIALVIFGSFSSSYAESQMEFYDKLFDSIEEQRVGLSYEELNSVKDPFAHVIVSTPISTPNVELDDGANYILEAIINNKARIDNKWYVVNNKIDNYVVTKIDNGSVILSDDVKDIKLSINRQRGGNVLIKFNK